MNQTIKGTFFHLQAQFMWNWNWNVENWRVHLDNNRQMDHLLNIGTLQTLWVEYKMKSSRQNHNAAITLSSKLQDLRVRSWWITLQEQSLTEKVRRTPCERSPEEKEVIELELRSPRTSTIPQRFLQRAIRGGESKKTEEIQPQSSSLNSHWHSGAWRSVRSDSQTQSRREMA